MTAATQLKAQTSQKFEFIPLSAIHESPTNPRHDYDKDSMTELMASIRAHGVLQPVLVRPGKSKDGYELVFGHRRFRAAKSAGLDVVPALVRALSDVEVLETQLVENCRRQDINPLCTEHSYGEHDQVGQRRGWDMNNDKELAGRLDKMTAEQLRALYVELRMTYDVEQNPKKWAEHFGVDAKKVETEAKALVEETLAAAKAAEKAPPPFVVDPPKSSSSRRMPIQDE